MPSSPDQSHKFERLRQQAEELLGQRQGSTPNDYTDVFELIHELEIHQAELEIQNEELQRSRQECSEFHESYACLYEFAPCGYLTLNPKGVITRINLTGVSLLGADRHDALHRSLRSFLVRGSESVFLSALNYAAETGDKQSRELKLQRGDGSLIWVQADIQAARTAKDELAEYQATLVDITERKQAEAELSLQARISHIFLSVSDEDMYAHVLDAIKEVLDSPFGYFGYINREGDLVCPSLSKDIWEECQMQDKDIVFPQSAWGGLWGQSLRERTTLRSNGPLSLPQGHVQFQRAMASAIVDRGELVGQIALARHSAEYTEQDRLLLVRISNLVAPILSARLKAARREQERYLTEEALRQSEEKYRQLAEGTEAILWEYHIPSDRWTYVAPQAQKILGYRPEEWTGLQFWVQHIHREDRDWARRYCLDCTSRGESHTFEYRFLAKDGRVVWLRDVVSVEMEEDKPVKLRGFMVDITEQKELERLKEDVDRITRHDLKSPLNGIISLPQLLIEDSNLSQRQRELLRDIQGAGQRMLYLINMSLGLYQMERGDYEFAPKPVDILAI